MSAPRRFACIANKHWPAVVVAATLATLVGCGGGGGGTTPPSAPAVSLSPSSLTFASQNVGSSSTASPVTLTNTGNATLTGVGISITGTNAADFTQTNNCGTSVSAGSNCTISVTFTPTAAGSRTASVSITDNAAGSPQTISLTGTGQTPGPAVSLSPSSLTFASQIVNTTSAAQSVTLTNSGNATLTGVSISITGANASDFAQTNTCGSSVSAGSNCTISVTFTPTATGSRTGTVSIADNAPGSPQTIGLTGTGVTSANNVASVTVDLGPDPVNSPDADVLFVTLTVCVPGSTSNCQTIDHVAVDTGSSGLRLLQAVLSPSLASALPQENAPSGSPLGNCVVFADNSFMWGLVVTADISIAGETASAVPIQVISQSSPPAGCSGSIADNTVDILGANGLIGVSVFRQDCGQACVNGIPTPNPPYFSCPASGCTATTVPLSGQLQNPVWMFPQDNNGLLINLLPVPDQGAATDTGTMTFGIGTQSNNSLGSATIYTTSDVGEFTTTYNGSSYTSYIDSGSNGMYFLDSGTTGMPDCPDGLSGYYCPANTTSFTVTNTGLNGNSGPVTFKIANTENLNPSFAAFNDLGGSLPNTFDLGLPFFFGRTIFVGIEGENVNGTNGPLWAY